MLAASTPRALGPNSASTSGAQRYSTAISLSRKQLHPPRGLTVQARAQPQEGGKDEQQSLQARLGRVAASAVLASVMALSPLAQQPAQAVDMVPAQQMLQMAKPMPKPVVDKGLVWVVFVGGAALLFGSTLVVENNESWFPAITRANQYMKMKKKASQAAEKRAAEEEAEWKEIQRTQSAVEAGLKDAKKKVLPALPAAESAAPAPAPSPAPAAPAQELASTSAPAASAPASAAPVATAAPVAAAEAHTPSPSTSAPEPEPEPTPMGGYAVVANEPAMAAAWGAEPTPAAPAASTSGAAKSGSGNAVAAAVVGAAAAAASTAPSAEAADLELASLGDEVGAEARAQRLAAFVSGMTTGGSASGPLQAMREEQQRAGRS